MGMEPEKAKETDPDLSDSGTEESEEKKLNATSVSALDMILKSLWKISVFLSDFLVDYIQEAHESLVDDDSVLPQELLRSCLLKDPCFTHPLESNGVTNLFLNILEFLPRWNKHFEVKEEARRICVRCKKDMSYYGGCSYGMIVFAYSLREFKIRVYYVWHILKGIRINLKTLCSKEGCEKRNYVETVINNLPSAFTIALKWENNETEEEIFNTASVFATVIDLSEIYQYEGDSRFTKYRLVSMVWSHGDQYNCVAYEKTRWVRYFCSEKEVIGDWDGVLSIFRKLHIRPEILFFENAMQRDKMYSALGYEDF